MKQFEYEGYGNTADNDVKDLFNDSKGGFLEFRRFSPSKFKDMIRNEHLEIAELYYLGSISYMAFAALHFLGDYDIRGGNQYYIWQFEKGHDPKLDFDEKNTKKWFKTNWYDVIKDYKKEDDGWFTSKHPGLNRSYDLRVYPEIKQLLLDWEAGKIINKNYDKQKIKDMSHNMYISDSQIASVMMNKKYLIKFAKMEISRLKKLKNRCDYEIERLKNCISKLKEEK